MLNILNKIKGAIKVVDKDSRDFVIVMSALALFFAIFQPNSNEDMKGKSTTSVDASQKTKPKDCFHIPSGSVRPVFVNREDEIKATDLVWHEDFTKLPAAAKKLIRKEVPSGIEDYDINRWLPEGYDGYHVIVYWVRGGGADTDQVVMAYKNHEYKDYSITPVPLNVLYSNDFQKMILDLNWMCWDYWN
jgi:hypothetical protein